MARMISSEERKKTELQLLWAIMPLFNQRRQLLDGSWEIHATQSQIEDFAFKLGGFVGTLATLYPEMMPSVKLGLRPGDDIESGRSKLGAPSGRD